MNDLSLIRGRRRPARRKGNSRPLEAVLASLPSAAGGSAGAAAYPGYLEPDSEGTARTLVTGSLAALLHAGGIAILVILASLAPVIEEKLIPVRILQEEPPPPDAPAPAPRALAERRALPFAPAIQAVAPQIVNPDILAQAAPRLTAEALEMDAVDASATPSDVADSAPEVERVSAVDSTIRARVGPVDLSKVTRRAVRGPTKVEARVGPSVGPRRVQAANLGKQFGTAALEVGSGTGSSVQEGIRSNRDVVGSPDGALVFAVDTSLGDGAYGGGTPGGTGTGPPVTAAETKGCYDRPEVSSYISMVRERTIERWVLPPGVDSNRGVTLRFQLDVAGSATRVDLVRAEDNALGASAIDALRAAAPFPPMPEAARCLARISILGTFSNPVGG